jgi:hypothetical protein
MTDRDRLAGDATAIARKLASVAASGEEGRVNRRLIAGLAEEGLLPRLFPRRAGGTRDEDVSAVDLCAVREALARESTVTENAIAIQTLGAYPIVLAGSDEQAERYARPVARGEAVAAFALTGRADGQGLPSDGHQGVHLECTGRRCLHDLCQDDTWGRDEGNHGLHREWRCERSQRNGATTTLSPSNRPAGVGRRPRVRGAGPG